ncbi:MAG: flagellar biosynthetic protein FliR [Bdellovibrionales bacterium]|nr:flagellar biosynthetic protein FliR [Bdellovibrionales bacterium]
MAEGLEVLNFGNFLVDNAASIWTFFLLSIRFFAMMMLLPGLNGGPQGRYVRTAGILMMAFASSTTSPNATLPPDLATMIVQGFSEALLGLAMGLLPALLIAGVVTGGQLSANTMGLGASQLIDPTLGQTSTSLGRVFGDLTAVLFLLMGGHYVVIKAVSGLGGTIIPGTFVFSEISSQLLIDRTGDIFRVGVMVSAPVIVALLLTQFVMGLVTKAVPSVNIFIVSFPLTIGIGLVLSALSLPELLVFVEREIVGVENSLLVLVEDTKTLPQVPDPGAPKTP